MSKLRLKTALGFSIGDIGGNLYFSIIGFIFIFYLTEQLGLSGTLAGTAMLIGKIWDAVTDPIVSSISDRTKSKFGRRRPFIFWGALLLAVSMVLMFSMPRLGTDTNTFIKYAHDIPNKRLMRQSVATAGAIPWFVHDTGDVIATNVDYFGATEVSDQIINIELEFDDGSDWQTEILRRNLDLPPTP